MVSHPDPWRQSSLTKPRFRGWLHTAMVPVSLVAAVAGVVVARSAATRLAAGAFGLSVVFMFVTSALFNRRWWSDRAWRTMRQVDQTAIYVLIAGSYTGLVAVAPDGHVRVLPVAAVWLGTAAGIALRWAPLELPRGVQSGLFVVLGLLAGLAIPKIFGDVSAAAGWLVLSGGLLYVVGVVVLGARRPDPWPRTFGYHEIWHAMVVAALGLHYVAVIEVVS